LLVDNMKVKSRPIKQNKIIFCFGKPYPPNGAKKPVENMWTFRLE